MFGSQTQKVLNRKYSVAVVHRTLFFAFSFRYAFFLSKKDIYFNSLINDLNKVIEVILLKSC